jgi:hypothetical protein
VRLPNRGVRERLYASQVATRFRGRKKSICCGYGEDRCRKTGKDFIACADSDGALGSRDCVQSSFSQLKLSENRRKQFHRQQRGTLHAEPSSTLSNSTNGWPGWQLRSKSEDEQF